MPCMCQIIPNDVLRRLRERRDAGRRHSPGAIAVGRRRRPASQHSGRGPAVQPPGAELGPLLGAIAPAPAVTVDDCRNGKTLPGVPVANPGHAADISAQRAFVEAGAVADFYKKVFNRNSIDNAGMTIMSSVHFGTKYNNAQWTGTQMLYGDGDGQLFIDFTGSNDADRTRAHARRDPAHTLKLAYGDRSGGSTRATSDVFRGRCSANGLRPTRTATARTG